MPWLSAAAPFAVKALIYINIARSLRDLPLVKYSIVLAIYTVYLYIHLVRPHLEFASEVWSPHQIFLKDMLEAVQRRATRLMVKNKPYKERLQELNLLSLTSRREYLDLVFLYKCMHNYVDSELPNYLELYDLSKCAYQLRNKKLTFKSISARTNSFKFSFFPRVATAWNDLPLDIRECASLSDFKSKLKKYYIVVDSDKVFGR